MKVSMEWISEFLDLSGLGVELSVRAARVGQILTSRGIEVEEIAPLGRGFEHVFTAKILERAPHPQADRLSVCRVTDGKMERQIVCGAQNMKVGDVVAMAVPGANLPNGMKIGESKIRGVASAGMLCSESELGLKAESEGIMILPPDTPLGVGLASVLGRQDVILTLKLTANRADCLSHWGIARELGAALEQAPRRPGAVKVDPEIAVGSVGKIDLSPANADCPQFLAVKLEGLKSARMGNTPGAVVRRLESLGLRSIDPVVDATQWVMLELGHPTHAYDAERVDSGRLGVRQASAGEKADLLDGSSVTLLGGELVVVSGADQILGLAGVMGGAGSQVTDATRSVILECAEFAPALVRRASQKHAKKTDAAHRFERGIDPAALDFVMARLVQLVQEWAGGQVVGRQVVRVANPSVPTAIPFSPALVKNFLGMELDFARVRQILLGLGCQVRESGPQWQVIPPSYRLDLRLWQDLCEEVARTVGYDAIPETLPVLTSEPRFAGSAKENFDLVSQAKDACVRAGLSESLQMAFSSREWLKEFGLEVTSTGAADTALLNPISAEFEVLVPSLIPGLVQSALSNLRHHFGSEQPAIRLFELRPVFAALPEPGKGGATGETGFAESPRLAWLISGPRFAQGLRVERGEWDFADCRAWFESFQDSLGLRGVRMIPIAQSRVQSAARGWFHPHQSVEILAGARAAGFMGRLHPGLAKRLKLKADAWICELDWSALSALAPGAGAPKQFKEWSNQPPMERDFALVVKDDVPAAKLVEIALKSGRPLAKKAQVFDVYRGASISSGMTSVAVRVIFSEDGRSLQEPETEAACQQIVAAWRKELGAELRT